MALSDTARRILAEAAQHPLRLAAPPNKLPAVAARAMLNNLVKQGYVEECAAPMEYVGLRWHQQDGTKPMVRITEAGLLAIGAAPTNTTAVDEAGQETAQVGAGMVPADLAQEPGNPPLGAPATPAVPVCPPAQRPARRFPRAPACATLLTASSPPGTTRRASARAWPTRSPPSAPFW